MGQAKRRGTMEQRAAAAGDDTEFVINHIRECVKHDAIFLLTERKDVPMHYSAYAGDIYQVMTKNRILISGRGNRITGAVMNDDGTMNLVSTMTADTPVIVIMPKIKQSVMSNKDEFDTLIKGIEATLVYKVAIVYRKVWMHNQEVVA